MNIKKILMIVGGVLIVLLGGVVLYGTFFMGSGTASGQAEALEDGTLTVALVTYRADKYVSQVDAPSGQGVNTATAVYDGSTQYFEGIEVDLAYDIAASAGVEVEFVAVANQTQGLDALNTGTADLLLGQIGYDYSIAKAYLTSVSYGTGGLYIYTPAQTYVSTFAGLDGQDTYISDNIPVQMTGKIANLENMSQQTYPTVEEVEEWIALGAQMADNGQTYQSEWEVYFLVTEGEAVKYASMSPLLQMTPLVDSPVMDYVAVANLGDTTLIQHANAVVNAYLDGLATQDVSGDVA